MCDIHTVTELLWTDVGARLRQARVAAGLSQAELGGRTGLDRTAVSRIESGERQIDALELRSLSEALHVPLPHLVSAAPEAIVSRRSALGDSPDAASRSSFRLDLALEGHLRDARMLSDLGHLAVPGRPDPAVVRDGEQARALAIRARQRLGLDDEPLGAMARVCEQLGLLILVVADDADGASLQDETMGVAVLGSRAEPGRRRATAAHELGHHLLGDAYSSDLGIATSRDDRERLLECFAAELLLPRSAVRRTLQDRHGPELRAAVIRLAADWRVSWSLAVSTATEELTLGESDRRLLAADPTKADFLAELGRTPSPDLELGTTGPGWRKAALAAYRAGDVSAIRATELLHGLIASDELERTDGDDSW